MLSLGLCRAFKQAGLHVKPFKKGPDYIDAAWLGAAAGNAATCLDPFFMDAAGLRALFCESMAGQDLAIIEGNRGLFDGLNESGVCSTSQVARSLQCPIVICIDCAKSTRTIAAILNGLVNFEPGLNIAGVVPNRVGSPRHAKSLQSAIEANTNLKILGCLPRLASAPLPERHMGLASFGAGLSEQLEEKLDALAEYISSHCDLPAILAVAKSAPPLLPPAPSTRQEETCLQPVCRIGVVRDQALWFYYPENLAALEKAGAQLVFLSLLDLEAQNSANWQRIDGLYMGGGFPEDIPGQISASPFLEKIRSFAQQGLPIYAECGGLIILCEALEKDGKVWPMAGLFSCRAQWLPKPQGLGYVEAIVQTPNPWHQQGRKLLGHEFHYSCCQWQEAPEICALNLRRGVGIYKDRNGCCFDGLIKGNVWASYTHIFAPANPHWAANFIGLAKKYRARNSLPSVV